MYNVLVVGCGGSGAKTVAFMMDQLKADLRRYGIEEIPACWQFISVDTPVQEEDMANLGVAKVSDQGGQYIACGVGEGVGYSDVDQTVTDRLTTGNPYGLREVATWMPQRPGDVTFPIGIGAGKNRGIGRLLVLNHLTEISAAVREALQRMRAAEAQELIERATGVPGFGGYPNPLEEPMVLIVSSMAGGSGASMALDVGRLIAMIPGFTPDHTAAFLYTADVFGEVDAQARTDMSGNTLAMLGELIAVQAAGRDGASAKADGRLYEHFGLNGDDVRLGIKRVVPLGASVGGDTGAVAGRDSIAIFRSVGRGLARYISGPAFNSYVSFDLGNPVTAHTSAFGWGVNANSLIWSSFGYASFSLGRERYSEYAAQRISRRIVDHVLGGHRLDGEEGTDGVQLNELWNQNKRRELKKLGLPEFTAPTIHQGRAYDEGVALWVEQELGPPEDLKVFSHRLVERVLSGLGALGEGLTVSQWKEAVSQLLRREKKNMKEEIEEEGLRRVWAWTNSAQDRLVSFTSDAVGRLGLPYTHKVLDELSRIDTLADQLSKIAQQSSPEPWVFPPSLATQTVEVGGKGTLATPGFDKLQRGLVGALENAVYKWILTDACGPLARAVREYSTDAVTPMKSAVGEAIQILQEDQKKEPNVAGVAQVESHYYQQWPRDPYTDEAAEDAVPSRFSIASNEVVIMKTDEYLDRFNEHIVSSVAADRAEIPGEDQRDVRQAYEWAMRDVLRGTRKRAAEDEITPDLVLVEVKSRWIPRGFQQIHQTVGAHPAKYRLRLRSGEILDRARKFVERSGEAFEVFAAESIHHYLVEPDSDHERQQRLDSVLGAMGETITKALPLSSIGDAVFRKLHTAKPKMHLEFSALPFHGIGGVQAELPKVLKKTGREFDNATVQSVTGPFNDGAQIAESVTRIDIFGANDRTLPIAYSGILNQVRADWNANKTNTTGRKLFRDWKRARPLPAALPFGDDEREAFVKGWFLAQVMGGVKTPKREAQSDNRPVRIWDPESEEWVNFPAPMMRTPQEFRVGNEWLPAVLESSLLAFLQVSSSGLDALRPYNVLRRYTDKGETEKTSAFDIESDAQQIMRAFLSTGKLAPDGIPRIDSTLATFDERRDAVVKWLEKTAKSLQDDFLPEGKRNGVPGRFTDYSNRTMVVGTPLTIDLAEEMVAALQSLAGMTRELPSTNEGDEEF